MALLCLILLSLCPQLFLNPNSKFEIEIRFCIILQGIQNFFWFRHSQNLVGGLDSKMKFAHTVYIQLL